MSETRDYRDTVFLPVTSFPMRGDLPNKEPAILARWAKQRIWQRIREASKGRAKFILHDGPPYANGNLHIGHALNKILKDVINRGRQMAGFDGYYIPGWDCHGLPIEWKIEEEYRKSGRDKDAVPILQFRAECRAYAAHWLAVQQDEFQRLGVFAAWDERYATMDLPSEAAIAGEIGKFLLNGSLFRGLRPVMWSPVEKTALAEAEIEYHDHTSTTIFVRFPIWFGAPSDEPEHPLSYASVVIWTTTPWTIPGNRALACGADIDYAFFKVDSVAPGSLAVPGEGLLVAQAQLPEFAKTVGIETHHTLHVYKGSELGSNGSRISCHHPWRGLGHKVYELPIRMFTADFVTTEAGTGFVHIAPGHGEEDFLLGRAHEIEVPDTVGPDGTYNDWVPMFAGQHVYKVADNICSELQKVGRLLARGKLVHSYPHSWRSRAPLIFRATPQWFIRMDGPEDIRGLARKAIDETDFVPEAGRTRLDAMIAARPDWCISRQRAWGVPIAVFVEKATGTPLRDPEVVRRIVDVFTEEGADAWYSSPPSRFLGQDRNPDDYEQVMDIVDVWFESGSTHAFVLRARGLPWPADLYLEGTDQHRGWFHSSLLESVGSTYDDEKLPEKQRGKAPFKAVLTHGFTLDEQGRKMSKSLGNTTAPQEVWDKYGADILRLWVMNTDITEDQRIGPEILKQTSELYRRLRNTLRWLLGSLDGFRQSEHLPEAEMPELERWVLHRLWELDNQLRTAVDSHDWAGVYPAIHSFCATDLSAFYFDIRKDTLYCDRPDHLRRRAARTVLDHLHRCLATWLAPVLVFTAEEAWTARFGEDASVHLQDFYEVPERWRDDGLAEKWLAIRARRSTATTALEAMRRDGRIGSSLQAAVTLGLLEAEQALLSPAEWAEVLIVSAARVSRAAEPSVATDLAPGDKCARCWKVLPEVGRDHRHATLCLRCTDAVEAITTEVP